MTAEQQEYLDHEFRGFEERFFPGGGFWRVPAFTLVNTALFSIYEEFCASFPDHPNQYETVFYLAKAPSGDYSILFRCPHFEHTSSDDLPELARFIELAAAKLTSSKLGFVELLDGNSEKLHLRFYSPREEVIEVLKALASATR